MDITVCESELYYCGFKHSNESWYENMGTEMPPIKKKHLKVKSYKSCTSERYVPFDWYLVNTPFAVDWVS